MNKGLDEAVKKHPSGTVINLFVTADADANIFPSGFNKWRKSVEIKVNAPAEKNKANLEIIKIMSTFFNKSQMDVLVVSGKKNREKSVLIRGVSVSKVIDKIGESLDGL